MAVVSDSLSRLGGGVFESVLALCAALRALGDDVRAFGVADAGPGDDTLRWGAVGTTAAVRRGPVAFGYAPRLAESIAEWQPDVIHAHGLWKYSTVAARQASSRLDCPLVISTHGMLDRWALQNAGWKKRLAWHAYERHNFERAALFHALNKAECASLRAFGVRKPVIVAPNGVELPAHVILAAPDDTHTRTLLYLGRLHPKKGLEALLHGWATVQQSRVSGNAAWTLVVAGWGEDGYAEALRSMVDALNIQQSVRFVGPQFGDAKDRWLRECAAMVLPSFSEGQPMAILEAWAYGKPVILTPQCNLPEGVFARAAIEAEPTADAMAGALRALMDLDDAERHAMGQRGCALVRERYTWTATAGQLDAAYGWLLNGGNIPENVHGT